MILNLKSKISSYLKHPFFTGSVLMIGGNMFANIMNYLYQLLMGRNLGIIGYGELSSIFAIFYILIIIPTSASPSIIKFISTSQNHSEAIYRFKILNNLILKISIGITIFIIVISPFISSFLKIPFLDLVLLGPIIFLSLITLSNQSFLQGILRFWGNVAPNILSSVLKLILGIILVLLGWKVFGAMAGVLIGVFFAYFYSYYLVNKFIKGKKVKGVLDLKKFFIYSLPVLMFSFSFTSFFTMDIILVKHFFSEESAGIYATLAILGKIIYFAAAPIASVMFPLIAGRHSKGEKYFELLLASLLITIFIAFGITCFYALFPNYVISMFTKDAQIPTSGLIWMGLFICFYTISFFMMNFFLSIDKVKLVILPLIFAALQIAIIWFYHPTLLTVIQISLVLMLTLFIILFSYLVYNRINNERKQT